MSEFIEVSKEGEENIFIHPDALKDHQRLGWVVVEEEAVSAETVTGREDLAPTSSRRETAAQKRAREKTERDAKKAEQESDDEDDD